MTDLIVVGGGPVGLVTALLADRSGLSVTVIDRRPGVIDKACGEGIMPAGLALLQRIGVDPPGHAIDGIRYIDRRGSAEARFEMGAGRGVRRISLHAALRGAVEQAGIGTVIGKVASVISDGSDVEVLLEPTPQAATTRPGSLYGARAGSRFSGPSAARGQQRSSGPLSFTETGPVQDRSLGASYVVAADGLHSTVRSSLGLAAASGGKWRLRSRRHPASVAASRRRHGLRRHFAIEPWTSLVEVHWSLHAEAYVTPVAQDEIGIAILTPHAGSFEDHLRAFPELMERVSGADASSQVRGAGPFSQRTSRRVSGNVLLVGDAAGYVDAVTGEGLTVGWRQGAAAVHAITRGRPEEYERSWPSITRRSTLLTAGLTTATRFAPVRRSIVPAASRFPRVFAAAVNQAARG